MQLLYKNKNNMNTKKTKGRAFIYVLFIVIILALLGSVGWLYTQYNEAIVTISNVENDLVEVNTEKSKLLKELDSLEAEIQQHLGQNATLDSLLLIKKDEIESLRVTIRSQRNKAAQYDDLKRKFDILETQAKDYIRKNAYLSHQVDSLTDRNNEQKVRLDTLEIENFEKSKQIDELVEKVEIGAQLQISNITVNTYNQKGKAIARAKRVENFEVKGTILKNALAEAGSKTIYIRITSPNGIVLTNSSANQFEYEGKTVMYSDTRNVTYNNNNTNFEVYFTTNEDQLEVGTYKITIFCDNKEVGNTTVELN